MLQQCSKMLGRFRDIERKNTRVMAHSHSGEHTNQIIFSRMNADDAERWFLWTNPGGEPTVTIRRTKILAQCCYLFVQPYISSWVTESPSSNNRVPNERVIAVLHISVSKETPSCSKTKRPEIHAPTKKQLHNARKTFGRIRKKTSAHTGVLCHFAEGDP